MQLVPSMPFSSDYAYPRGILLETEEENLTASLTVPSVAPIQINDELHFEIVIDSLSEPLDVFHGTTAVGTVSNTGIATFDFTALSTANYFVFSAGGDPSDPVHVEMSWPSITRA